MNMKIELDEILKYIGWFTWFSLVAMLYGFGWKVAWPTLVTWDYMNWTGWDFLIYVSALLLIHAGFFLLMILVPVGIKKYIKINRDKKTSSEVVNENASEPRQVLQ